MVHTLTKFIYKMANLASVMKIIEKIKTLKKWLNSIPKLIKHAMLVKSKNQLQEDKVE